MGQFCKKLHGNFLRQNRSQVWRYVSYSLVHHDADHIFANLFILLAMGVLLEMVHGGARISALYILGVLVGSLGSFTFDYGTGNWSLFGSSGGVYSLM